MNTTLDLLPPFSPPPPLAPTAFVCPNDYICSPWDFKSKMITVSLLSTFAGVLSAVVAKLLHVKFAKKDKDMDKIVTEEV